VTTSLGTNAQLEAAMTFALGPVGLQLQKIDLSDPVFQGTSLTISAKRGTVGGDGYVDVGFVQHTGRDLGKVVIDGDLGRISGGDATVATPAVKSLTVQSMGVYGLSTQDAGSLTSSLEGGMGKLTVKADLRGVLLRANDGGFGSVTVGGSLVGDSTTGSGSIIADLNIGTVTIGGSLIAAGGVLSGAISAQASVGAVTIGGSIYGPSVDSPAFAQISAGQNLGPVIVMHDIIGGSGEVRATIGAGERIASVSIGGSVYGGTGDNSGSIIAGGSLGNAKIGGSVVGGDGDRSGQLASYGTFGNLVIGGDLIGGVGSYFPEGKFFSIGHIYSVGAMGNIKIAGSMIGGEGISSATIDSDTGTGSITIGGSIKGGMAVAQSGGIRTPAAGPILVGGDLVGGAASGGAKIEVGSFGKSAFSTITVKGSLQGGTGTGTAVISVMGSVESIVVGGDLHSTANLNGRIDASGMVGSVKIGGDIVSSGDANQGQLSFSAGVRTVSIGGSILGNELGPVRLEFDPKTDGEALGKLRVAGSAVYAVIQPLTNSKEDLSIGKVIIGGDWIASSLSIGTSPGPDFIFGTSDDTFLEDETPETVGTLGSLVIKGRILGTVGGTDEFRIMAPKIGKLRWARCNTRSLTAQTILSSERLPM
jgi:hypothetical protein